MPPSLISTSGKMVVVFVSDRSVSGIGFNANYQAVDINRDCDRTFTASSGRFNFNASELKYTVSCDYHIMVKIYLFFNLIFS